MSLNGVILSLGGLGFGGNGKFGLGGGVDRGVASGWFEGR